ncbi:MAG: DUF5668 domain-containing protein [Candidatus Krumholzibacteria bacterium]|jgi:hypothetical protein|nr:DUF5668 domain-containing protein [Candidatus Krumholzibacteria bacterium]
MQTDNQNLLPQSPRPEPAPRRRDLPYKVPFLAGFLSGIFPGVGQLYVGYYRQGITLGILFAGIITILAAGEVSPLEPFLGITLGFCWLYGIIDAARRAQAVNRALDGFGQEPLPEDFALPGGGSMFGGSVLVILGVIMLLHTRFDVSLEWLEEWWPLLLVAVGGWLIWQARKDSKTA